MRDRRRDIRWQTGRQAKLKLEGSKTFIDCYVKDINFKGLQISLRMKLPPDTFLKFTIVLSEEFVLEVEAWVVWHKRLNDFNVYGLYFSQIKDDDKEKIYKFVYNNFPQEATRRWARERGIKGGEIMEDRRIFARLPVSLPLRFIDVGENKEGEAETQDISAKGIGLVTNEELSPRTPLEMWLQLPDRSEPLYTRGEVVWSRALEPNKYQVGVELEKADLMGMARVLRT